MSHPHEFELIEALVLSLQAVPRVDAVEVSRELSTGASGIDAVVTARVDGRPLTLVVETKASVYPRDVREALWRLRDIIRANFHTPDAPIPLLAAINLSPGAKDLLRNENVAYFEMGGTLFLPSPQAFIHIERPPGKRVSRQVAALFEGRRNHVLQAVFNARHSWVSVKAMAAASHASAATVSSTMLELERRDWVETRGAGPSKTRRLTNPRSLLDAWARHVATRKPTPWARYFLPRGLRSAETVALDLARACESRGVIYAVSGETAAQAYSPYLSAVSRTQCRILRSPGGQDRSLEILSDLRALPVDEGSNLEILVTPDRGDFINTEHIEGVTLASPLQTWLDLLEAPGRAKEMADHLRAERLSV